MKNIHLMFIIGTRPEAIKMAPLIAAARQTDWAKVRVVVTAQHREMLDQVLCHFGITPDIDLNLMTPNQSLSLLTARLITELDAVISEEKPDAVLAQGDTTTVMAAALTCFYHRIPFGHVEAGLRSGDMLNPFPEEMNRVLAGKFAQWHFAPTQGARRNLLQEGVRDKDIFVTGNTVIDALLQMSCQPETIGVELDPTRRLVLVTVHRRENFGKPLEEIFRAIRFLADTNPDVEWLYPVHPNPNVWNSAREILKGHNRIKLCVPLGYAAFVKAMNQAYMILTDSGGVQEEAPALGKPVLVLRRVTERPEAVEAGVVKVVGSEYGNVIREAQRLLDDPVTYREMARGVSPYGDGHASKRIVAAIHKHFFESGDA